MVSFIYTIVSSIVFALFGFLFQLQYSALQVTQAVNQAQHDHAEQLAVAQREVLLAKLEQQAAAADAKPLQTYSDTEIPQKNLQPENSQFGAEQYVVEPIGEGFYKMHNVPVETMSTVAQLNEAVNTFRATHALNRLEMNERICAFANQRAQEISQEFSHDGFTQHIEAGDLSDSGFTYFGENIWQGSFMGVHIVEYGWARSPGHYAALVGQWNVGCAGIYDTFAVFIFAR